MKIAAYVFGAFCWMLLLNVGLRLTSGVSDVEVLIGVGLLIALVAGALAVTIRVVHNYTQAARHDNPGTERFMLLIVAVTLSSIGCGTTVQPGYVGIVVDMYGKDRGVQSYAVTTGRVWFNPWTTSVLEYPTFVQSVVFTQSTTEGKPVNEEITFTNADQMSIAADVSLSYSLTAQSVPAFYVKFRSDDLNHFTHGYLRSLMRDKFNDIAGKYRIEQIMGDNGPFLKEVKGAIQTDLDPIGVKLEAQFGFIGAPRPPAQVIQSINLKVQATQLAFQKQNELVQVQADALKEAAKAEGLARAAVAEAKGKAEATRIAADADAQYNRVVAASLTPLLVENRKAGAWDGKLPQVSGASTPFITLK